MYELKVIMYGDPDVVTNKVMPGDSKEVIKEKNKKPFIARKSAILKIEYMKTTLYIHNETLFAYDGASIPFRIGKGDMRLLVPALWHDIICIDKSLVNYDRQLSSRIFRELLIQCGNSKLKAYIMYFCVDNWQKLQKGWRR